jgi:hypothetical protein
MSRIHTGIAAIGLIALASLASCGGAGGNVEVGKSVASFEVTSVATQQRQQLASANVHVLSAKCFSSVGSDGFVGIGTPQVLYVYEIPADDAEKAASIDFRTGFSREGYSSTSMTCDTPADIPAL